MLLPFFRVGRCTVPAPSAAHRAVKNLAPRTSVAYASGHGRGASPSRPYHTLLCAPLQAPVPSLAAVHKKKPCPAPSLSVRRGLGAGQPLLPGREPVPTSERNQWDCQAHRRWRVSWWSARPCGALWRVRPFFAGPCAVLMGPNNRRVHQGVFVVGIFRQRRTYPRPYTALRPPAQAQVNYPSLKARACSWLTPAPACTGEAPLPSAR